MNNKVYMVEAIDKDDDYGFVILGFFSQQHKARRYCQGMKKNIDTRQSLAITEVYLDKEDRWNGKQQLINKGD